MKRLVFTFAALLALGTVAVVPAVAQVSPTPTQLNFQGRLATPSGNSVPNGTYSIRFSLWDVAAGGTAANEKWNQTLANVQVKNGTFAVVLNTNTANLFNSNLWLEIKVGADAALTPRQQLVSAPYAIKANFVADGSVTNNSIANASITANKFAANLFNSTAWLLNGNSSVTSGFLGTTDNKPLEFRVNNHRALRYSYAEDISSPGFEFRSINILGGSEINTIAPGVVGATIAGGGSDSFTGNDNPNSVVDSFGTIGGGGGNIAHFSSTIAGGDSNVERGNFGFIGGGFSNTITAPLSVIGGGYVNLASGASSTVGGGIFNTAGGENSTVPGGHSNSASGKSSFAAGDSALAIHDNTFVWADNNASGIAMSSTGPNQFVVRARGGVKLAAGTPIELGFGLPGKDAAAGTIGYGTFTINTLDIVGAGQNGSPRKVKIWSEGGLTVQQATGGATSFVGNQDLLNLVGSDHGYIQFFPRGFGGGRKGYLGFPAAGSHDLEIANEDTGVLRVRGTFVNSSDVRLKTHIADLVDPLDALLGLRGVSYEWRKDLPNLHATEQRQIGFLAQEVEKVLPELVYTDEKGYKSVNYLGVVPVLVEAVKTQQQKIGTLEARLDALAATVAELKANHK